MKHTFLNGCNARERITRYIKMFNCRITTIVQRLLLLCFVFAVSSSVDSLLVFVFLHNTAVHNRWQSFLCR